MTQYRIEYHTADGLVAAAPSEDTRRIGMDRIRPYTHWPVHVGPFTTDDSMFDVLERLNMSRTIQRRVYTLTDNYRANDGTEVIVYREKTTDAQP